MIDIKDIKKLQSIFMESGIGEIEVRHGRDAVRLTIGQVKGKARIVKAAAAAAPIQGPSGLSAAAQDALNTAETRADSGIYELRSKWIGFFTRLNSKTGEN